MATNHLREARSVPLRSTRLFLAWLAGLAGLAGLSMIVSGCAQPPAATDPALRSTPPAISARARADAIGLPASAAPEARNDPWWIARHAALKARAAAAAEVGAVRVVLIGDSITQGWEKSGSEPWHQWIAPLGAINIGIGGDRTPHIVHRIRDGGLDGLARSVRVAVLMIGTNDIGGANATPEATAAGVAACIDAVHDKLPDATVLLIGILPRADRPKEVCDRVGATNAIIRQFADGRRVVYRDHSALFLEADGSISKAIMPDLLHLSAEGYARWAQAIAPEVRSIVSEDPR